MKVDYKIPKSTNQSEKNTFKNFFEKFELLIFTIFSEPYKAQKNVIFCFIQFSQVSIPAYFQNRNKHTANKFAVLDRENVIAKLKCKNKIQEILLNMLTTSIPKLKFPLLSHNAAV